MNAKHLRELLEQGHHVECNTKSGGAVTFVAIVIDHKFIGYDHEKDFADLWDFCDNEFCSNYFTNDYKIVTPAPKLLEVGDEVEVLENYGRQTKAIYSVLIDKVYDSHYILILTDAKGEVKVRMDAPHRAVAKLPKEDETIKIIDGKKYKLVE